MEKPISCQCDALIELGYADELPCAACEAQLLADREWWKEYERGMLLEHRFRLRPELVLSLRIPQGLTASEAERLARFIKTLPFPPEGTSEEEERLGYLVEIEPGGDEG